MLNFQVAATCVNPSSTVIWVLLLMMDDVQGTDIHNWAKDSTNAEEAGHAGVENGVNVRTDNNLVSEHQIRNTDQNSDYNFADQKEHYDK